MVSALLMTFSIAVIGEIIYLNTLASTKLTNKADGQVATSRAILRIAQDIRSARVIGNIFSTTSPPQVPGNVGLDPLAAASGPPGGWPSSWPPVPYVLGPQTLILQIPAYYQDPNNSANPLNGFPLMQLGYPPSSGQTPLVECVDTIVYQVVADNSNPGTYQLQLIRLPGSPVSYSAGTTAPITKRNLAPLINPPQTVLSGIIGPINQADGTGKPAVFEYLSSPNSTFQGANIIPPCVGVSVNVEVQSPPNSQANNVQIIPGHVEAYARSSLNCRMTNN